MTSFTDPPPQGTSPIPEGQFWLYALSRFVAKLTPGSGGGGGGSGNVNSVSTTDAALTVSPTTGNVVVTANDFVGDAGSGGVHGDVPAPVAGDAAAGKFLKADATWDVPSGTSTGTVTSVNATVPAELSVSGVPITTSGTIAITKANESANTVWAGPTTGAAAQPTFRALVTADMPAGTGTVTSVGLTVPTEFSVSGSPVTGSGTLAVTKANESANTVWAGPTSGGAAAPTFRALVAADIPGGTGTVTSIATTAPITGGTITTTGTIGISDFVASGASHASGAVPDPGSTAGTTKFLCEDATFKTVPSTAGGALTQIAQVITTSSASTITFSSIPGTFSTLRVVISGRDTASGSGAVAARLQINGDTTSGNYTLETYLQGVGTGSPSTGTEASSSTGCFIVNLPGTSGNANAIGMGEIIIPMYAATTFHKIVHGTTYMLFGATPTGQHTIRGFVWKSTSAITSLVLTAGGTAFVDGTTATLYGMS